MKHIDNATRAALLTAAVPYIKEYAGKVVVVKYGGNAMTDENLKKSVMKDLLLLNLVGVKVVLVHGGGPAINEALAKMQVVSQWKDGLRVTDQETMDVVQMVLAGQVNKGLVANLVELGGKAVGLCGVDGHMIKVHQKDPELGLVGTIDEIDTSVVMSLLDRGYIPVISSLGLDKEGRTYNINADTVASKLAGALEAEAMIAMTNIDGVMADKDDPSSLIPHLILGETQKLIDEGVIAGGMIPKVECCTLAIQDGVEKVFIINGEIPHAILIELLTNEGLGTMFVKNPKE